MKPDIRVNRKFVILFILIQVILVGLVVYALVSPKSVTVKVEKLNNSFEIVKPLEPTVPQI